MIRDSEIEYFLVWESLSSPPLTLLLNFRDSCSTVSMKLWNTRLHIVESQWLEECLHKRTHVAWDPVERKKSYIELYDTKYATCNWEHWKARFNQKQNGAMKRLEQQCNIMFRRTRSFTNSIRSSSQTVMNYNRSKRKNC